MSESSGPRGIQSIEVGGQLLVALAHHGGPMPLKDLALAADMPPAKAHPYLVSFIKLGLVGMPPAKAHPYLVSFIKLGLVEQEAASGRYGLGPLSLQLGLISLQQYEPVRLATPRIEELALALGHTVAIAVWGNRGPTIVRVAEAPSPVHISMRHGTVMSLPGTASGRLFAAHLPRARVKAALAHGETMPDEELLEEVRRRGLASTKDGAVPGVSALAAPVFDDAGRIVLSLTAIGPSGNFDLRPNGAMAPALREAGEALSRQLGWRPG